MERVFSQPRFDKQALNNSEIIYSSLTLMWNSNCLPTKMFRLFSSVQKKVVVTSKSLSAPCSTSWRMVIDSPLQMLLVSSEERYVKFVPAPCAYSDQIVLLWVQLSIRERVGVGTNDCNEKHGK